jgi:L-ornithine N5-oxygenase
LLDYHRGTNYSCVDLPLIEDLYAREYAERVSGQRRLFVRGASSLFDPVESDGGIVVRILHQPTQIVDEIDCDAVIYATGFIPTPLGSILGEFHSEVVLDGGQSVISRDYRLATTAATAGNVYVQGNTEHTHGLSSTLLSNVAIRSGEILQSIRANRAALVTGAVAAS